jgi:hypothetical protein
MVSPNFSVNFGRYNFTRLIKLADIIDLGRENTEIVTLLRVNDPEVKAAVPPVH